MRVLRVIPTLDPAYGGPVAGLLATSEVLARAGVATEAVTLDAPDAPCLSAAPFPAIGHGPGWLKPGFTPRLGQWIETNAPRFDAAIVHGLWTHASVGGSAALRRAGVPYLLYPHGMMDPWFREAKPLKHWVKQAFWLAQGRALAGARAVVFTAEAERDLARGVFRGPNYTERVLLYGAARPPVSPDGEAAFHRAVPGLGDWPYILALGRVHPKKGINLLVAAHAAMPDAPDLVIAGPDPDGLIPGLLATGAPGRVHFAGPVYGDAKGAALAGAQALALISHQENFGLVLAEAMSLGTPVLTTRKVNIWKTIADGGAGLVGDDTQAGAQDLLSRFCAIGVQEKAALSHSALDTYERHFTPDRAAADLLALLREMSGERQCAA